MSMDARRAKSPASGETVIRLDWRKNTPCSSGLPVRSMGLNCAKGWVSNRGASIPLAREFVIQTTSCVHPNYPQIYNSTYLPI